MNCLNYFWWVSISSGHLWWQYGITIWFLMKTNPCCLPSETVNENLYLCIKSCPVVLKARCLGSLGEIFAERYWRGIFRQVRDLSADLFRDDNMELPFDSLWKQNRAAFLLITLNANVLISGIEMFSLSGSDGYSVSGWRRFPTTSRVGSAIIIQLRTCHLRDVGPCDRCPRYWQEQ